MYNFVHFQTAKIVHIHFNIYTSKEPILKFQEQYDYKVTNILLVGKGNIFLYNQSCKFRPSP